MKITVTLWGELPAHLEKQGRHVDLDKQPLQDEADVTFLVPIEGG